MQVYIPPELQDKYKIWLMEQTDLAGPPTKTQLYFNLGLGNPEVLECIARVIRHQTKANILTICGICGNNDDAWNADLTNIGEALKSHASLWAVSFQYTRLNADGVKQIAQSIRASSLIFEHCKFRNFAASCDALIGCSFLRSLILKCCELDTTEGFAIALALRKNPPLEDLNVAWNQFSSDAISAIGHALEDNSNLKVLQIGDGRHVKRRSHIGDMNPDRGFAKGLRRNQTLRELYYYEVDSGSGIIDALETNTGLKRVQFSYGPYGPYAFNVQHVIKSLTANTTLRTLDLPGLQPKDVAPLAIWLKSNRSILHLDIGNNAFDDYEQFRILIDAVKYNPWILDLKLICPGGEIADEEVEYFERLEHHLDENRTRHRRNVQRINTILNYRRSFQAWRDRSRIFISAREGRLMELRFRLRWGKLAGGLSLKGMCDGQQMTPLEAARKREHGECVELLLTANDI